MNKLFFLYQTYDESPRIPEGNFMVGSSVGRLFAVEIRLLETRLLSAPRAGYISPA